MKRIAIIAAIIVSTALTALSINTSSNNRAFKTYTSNSVKTVDRVAANAALATAD